MRDDTIKTSIPPEPIQVGISACLLGEAVRHDGGHRRSLYCADVLSLHFSLQPVCPEVGAGLGTPRRAMHLVEASSAIGLRTTPRSSDEKALDHTQKMADFNASYLANISHLRGFILMAKSPSCGMERVRVYDEQGEVLRRDAAGLFAEALMQRYPLLPVEEAGRLHDDRLCENFIARIYFYDDWCKLIEAGVTPAGLLDFHSRYKFQLLAHDQATYRQLGPLLANLKAKDLQIIADDYIHKAMHCMKRQASAGDNVNVMQHLVGYLRGEVDTHARTMINEQIAAYQQGSVPLIVPMTLIRNAQRLANQSYLEKQIFLHPYPDTLGLRNRL